MRAWEVTWLLWFPLCGESQLERMKEKTRENCTWKEERRIVMKAGREREELKLADF